jgi:hypothetical protein
MSPIMLRRGLARRLEAFDVPLDEMRRVAKASDGSLNDVFVAAVIGGVRRYHERHGAAPVELRMTLPIYLRQSDDDAGGNSFAPARFPVPTSIEDPRERIAALGTLIRGWRAEPALQMTSTMAGVLNRLPTSTTTALFGGMLKCCDFVTSNIPGAREEPHVIRIGKSQPIFQFDKLSFAPRQFAEHVGQFGKVPLHGNGLFEQRSSHSKAPEFIAHINTEFGRAAVGASSNERMKTEPAGDLSINLGHPKRVRFRRMFVKPRLSFLDRNGIQLCRGDSISDGRVIDIDDRQKISFHGVADDHVP